MGRLFMGPAIF